MVPHKSKKVKSGFGVMFWILSSTVIICLYIGCIGFTLHEERSNLKLRLLSMSTQFLSSHNSENSELVGKEEVYTYSSNISKIHNEEELKKYNEGYEQHSFNILVSDRIGFQARPLPDTRIGGYSNYIINETAIADQAMQQAERCHAKIYELQAQVSVIISYYNEALSALLRTISSVFKRTLPQLLKEIIVVDDGSETEYLTTIELFVEKNFLKGKLQVLRSNKQLGLARARMFGARHATGDILVFLDSHCEVNIGWIEPLLEELNNETSKVVGPIVDSIHPDTFAYEASPIVRGGFNWRLDFTWEALPAEWKDPLHAFPTPVLSGGLFAVNRDFFFSLGGFDEGMKIWGGESLEFSFRSWMCGGSVVISPCSRVGHVYRHRRPYGGNSRSSLKNAVRVAKTWLDDYTIHFLNAREGFQIDTGDMADMYDLRYHKLRCKRFKWYLNNIYPELGIPQQRKSKVQHFTVKVKHKILGRSQIKVTGLSICLMVNLERGNVLQAGICRRKDRTQKFTFTTAGEIRAGGKTCIAATPSNPTLAKCDGYNGSQKWEFISNEPSENDPLMGRLYNVAIGLCISINQASDAFETKMQICSKPSVQMFSMKPWDHAPYNYRSFPQSI